MTYNTISYTLFELGNNSRVGENDMPASDYEGFRKNALDPDSNPLRVTEGRAYMRAAGYSDAQIDHFIQTGELGKPADSQFQVDDGEGEWDC